MPISVLPILASVERPNPRKISPMPQILKLMAMPPSRIDMASAPRPLVAGNWKMNGLQRSVAELEQIARGVGAQAERVDILVCPPATLIASFAAAARGTAVAIGGQDCHAEPNGAFTGD